MNFHTLVWSKYANLRTFSSRRLDSTGPRAVRTRPERSVRHLGPIFRACGSEVCRILQHFEEKLKIQFFRPASLARNTRGAVDELSSKMAKLSECANRSVKKLRSCQEVAKCHGGEAVPWTQPARGALAALWDPPELTRRSELAVLRSSTQRSSAKLFGFQHSLSGRSTCGPILHVD